MSRGWVHGWEGFLESGGPGGGGWERCHNRRIEEEVSVVVFSSEGAGAMSRRDTKRGGEIAVGRRKGTDGGVGAGEWEGKRGRKKASRCTWGWFGSGHRPAGSSRSSGCQPLLGSWHCKATGRESREGCSVMGGGSATHPCFARAMPVHGALNTLCCFIHQTYLIFKKPLPRQLLGVSFL